MKTKRGRGPSSNLGGSIELFFKKENLGKEREKRKKREERKGKMVNEYALKEAFGKIKEEINEIKEEIKMLNEKLNNNFNNGEPEEPIEVNEIKHESQEEVNLTDSYY